jgi:hypothetical protein
MLRSGIFNPAKVVLLRYCFCCVKKSVSRTSFAHGFLVKKRRSQYFNQDGSLRTPIPVNQKNEFLVWDTRNVAFAGATFLPSLVSFFSLPDFLTLSSVALDQPWRTQRLPWLSHTSMALVGSLSYKKSSAFLI